MTQRTQRVTANARTKPRKLAVARNDTLVLTILERVADGEAVSVVCRDKGMPSRKAFYAWVLEDEILRSKYEAALQMRGELFAEQIVDIADGSEGCEAEEVSSAKLRVDARKWVVSKLLPKRYGDRTTLAGDPDSPLELGVKHMIAGSDELLKKIRGGK